ncbi:unnamed protein product [Prorocentrum cordatum]|uniref:Peroxisomal membrane protein PEX16 n=1 Tax=Prorocentrum cordatum TaxID=2364126 RepID=A0ABN9TVE8_9DINO|nr:unnamed protein product [Polarella glacialis]
MRDLLPRLVELHLVVLQLVRDLLLQLVGPVWGEQVVENGLRRLQFVFLVGLQLVRAARRARNASGRRPRYAASAQTARGSGMGKSMESRTLARPTQQPSFWMFMRILPK